jgi:hypothetical protein
VREPSGGRPAPPEAARLTPQEPGSAVRRRAAGRPATHGFCFDITVPWPLRLVCVADQRVHLGASPVADRRNRWFPVGSRGM